jgi:glycosyltransferase involved in cell wall biosynthesis
VLAQSTEARDTSKDPAVLIGFHWLSYGGAEKLAFDTVDWALEHGLRVIVVADVNGPQPLIDKLPDDPRVTVLRMDCYVPRDLMSAFLVALIGRENIVLTHNHHCTALYEALPAMRARCPNVVHIDSLHIVEHANGGYPRISGVWSNFLDYHHVISTDLKEFYRKNFRVNRKVILGRLLDDTQREATPQPLRIMAGQKTVRVIFVGRMMHQKRPILVVEIFRKLARWGQENGVVFQFDLVGEGPYRAAIDALVTAHGLRDCMRFHDAGTDVSALLAQSDILILPSTNEGLALVCYEAIEQGCVPISSDVGAQSELMPEALLVPWAPRRAVKDTVAAVKRLLSDPAHVLDMQTQLHARFAKLATEPSAKDVISALYVKAKNTELTMTNVAINPKVTQLAKPPKKG